MIKSSPDAIAIADITGKLIEVSDSFLNLFGIDINDKSSVIGKNGFELISPDDFSRAKTNLRKLLELGALKNEESTFLRLDGTQFHGELSLNIIHDKKSEPKYIVAILRDVSQRKEFEQKRRESEHNYRRIYETAQVGFWTSLIKGAMIIKANNKGAQILGLKNASEVIDTRITDYFAPEISTAIYQQLKQSGEVSNYEGKLIDMNGIEKIVSISARLFEKADDQDYIEGYIFDITDLKKAQEASKESEEKFRIFADQSHMGIAVVQDDSMKYVNEALSKINEYSIEEMMNWTPIDYMKTTHPEDIPKVMERIRRRQAGEKDLSDSFTCRCITKTGKIKWIESYGKTILYNGKYADYGSVIDITDRMEMDNRLRESQEMLQLVIDNIPQFIFWKDTDSRYMGCNKNFARVAGVNVPEYIVGLQDSDLAWEKEETDFFHETDALVMESDTPEFHIIEQQLQADGKHAWLDTNKIPLHDSNGDVMGLLGTYEDITERVIYEQALKKSEAKYREAYNNANFLKDIFSHDINNILQGIQTANELYTIAIEQNNPEELKELTEVIKLQVIRGAKLVNTIQKLSELEDYEQILEPTVIKTALEQSINNIRNLFKNRSINIRAIDLDNQDAVQANEFLTDIFDNLLINSVMFNEHQDIEVDITFIKESIDNRDYYRIEFKDNGTGIEEIRKSIIFQRASNKDKTISGLGLGLSLVKKVVDTYSGMIWVEDKVKGDHSKGSNFILLIPKA